MLSIAPRLYAPRCMTYSARWSSRSCSSSWWCSSFSARCASPSSPAWRCPLLQMPYDVFNDDDGVIENIIRHLEQGTPPRQAALLGAKEIGFTVLSITISLLAVFIPILMMGGIFGRLFR